MNRALGTKVVATARAVGILALVCAAANVSFLVLVQGAGLARSVRVENLRASGAALGRVTRNANQGAGMYGNPVAAAAYWRLQHLGDCGEMAVADVVGQVTGNEPTERQINAVAKSTPSATTSGPIFGPRGGTDFADLPALLAHYGIQSTLSQSTIGDLERDLAQAHKVIVSVNAETIWNQPGNRIADNHVLIVTGIDPHAGVVHLNDSGAKTGRDEKVSLATFEKAWAVGRHGAIVTN